MNFDKIDEIQITVQFCARCCDCCGCWVLGAGHCCGGCGHRSVTPGEAAQEAAPGSGELLWPPAHCTVAVAAAPRELRGKYASIKYLYHQTKAVGSP